MAAWIVGALCALILIKPQEFIGALAGVPLLYMAFGLTIVLVVLDIVWRRLRPALAPQLPYVVGFLLWGLLVTALKRPDVLSERALVHAVAACSFLVVGIGAGSSRGLRVVGAALLGCAVLVSAVAVMQGVSPYVCMVPDDPEDWEGKGELTSDGRPCETDYDCRMDAPKPEATYRCERSGPLSTSTQRGRVRYRGSLADPNELALMLGVALPFAFAFADRRRKKRRAGEGGAAEPKDRRARLPVLLTDSALRAAAGFLRAIPVGALVAAVGAVVVMSRSRSGLIVYLVVLGLYFIKRMGAWGVVAGCLIGPPMILLGGRTGVDAEESSDERVELIREAFELIKQTKGIGVGSGQFGDESSLGLTAHNAYLLAAAETGLIGLFLFGLLLYASVKVPIAVWFGDYDVDDTVARFAPALFVSQCGALAGMFFLSWAYKDVLYILLGASAALYQAARAQDERVAIRVSLREVLAVCGGMVVLLGVLNVLGRLHR